jgi:hypothetical protein
MGQPGGVRHARAERELRLVHFGHLRHRARRLGRAVQVDQQEPVRVLGLRRAQQPPQRGGGEIRRRVVAGHGDRAAGEERQPGAGQPRLRQPPLDQRQRLAHRARHVAPGRWPAAQNQRGYGSRRAEQRVEVGVPSGRREAERVGAQHGGGRRTR